MTTPAMLFDPRVFKCPHCNRSLVENVDSTVSNHAFSHVDCEVRTLRTERDRLATRLAAAEAIVGELANLKRTDGDLWNMALVNGIVGRARAYMESKP